jgi:hypothetical protein
VKGRRLETPHGLEPAAPELELAADPTSPSWAPAELPPAAGARPSSSSTRRCQACDQVIAYRSRRYAWVHLTRPLFDHPPRP